MPFTLTTLNNLDFSKTALSSSSSSSSSSSLASVLFQALGPYTHKTHKKLKTYSKTHTRNTQIMQMQVKLNKNSTG